MHFGNFMIIGLLSFLNYYCLKSAVPQGTAHAIVIIIFILTCDSVIFKRFIIHVKLVVERVLKKRNGGSINRIHVRTD